MQEITLRSGTWVANPVEVRHMPAGAVEWTYVFFHRTDEKASSIQVKVAGRLDPSTLEELAHRPDVREASIGGVLWRFYRISSAGGPQRVTFMSEDGGLGAGDLPDGVSLAEALDEELGAMTKTGRIR